jgi:hypothetical protein
MLVASLSYSLPSNLIQVQADPFPSIFSLSLPKSCPQVRPAEEAHLGIMGPMMRAAVGDTIEVTLRNNLDFPINMIPEGVTYTAAQSAAVAGPAETIKYVWSVPDLVRLQSVARSAQSLQLQGAQSLRATLCSHHVECLLAFCFQNQGLQWRSFDQAVLTVNCRLLAFHALLCSLPALIKRRLTVLRRTCVQAGPTAESDSSSAMWLYRSVSDQLGHANAGLFGPLIVTRAADADPATAKPRGVDAEFVTILQAGVLATLASRAIYRG